MKVLFFYTLNTIRRNKSTSLSIMAAVLLSSVLLCALCTYGYTQIRWRAEIEEYTEGNWHAELGGEIPYEKLKLAEDNLYVDKTMLKGPFSCLALSGESQLPYLLFREADENYWELMGEKNVILEGRSPQKSGEIVVSKSFFEKNPRYHLGDTLTLPQGERVLGGERLDETRVWKEGEQFSQTGEKTVTLVGKLDVTTNTAIPGYYAMGYMDRASLSGKEELVVYVKLKDIRKTYEVMPRIAEEIGIEKDEYGQYVNHFRYHARLLSLNFVFPPDVDPALAMEYLMAVLVYVVLFLLVMGAFVMIINGAFQISAMARVRQLGMFRSVGATPAQIVLSVLTEGLLLSAGPIMLSVGIGYLFTAAVLGAYSQMLGDLLYFPITVHFSLPLALLCAGACLITVLAAALIPALQIAGLSPIEAIRMQEREGSRRQKRREKSRQNRVRRRACKNIKHPILYRLFGYTGELAGAAHYAGRKSFRAGVMSLSFSLTLMIGFFSLMSMNDFLSERNRGEAFYNILVRLDLAAPTDGKLPKELLSVPGELAGTCYCDTRMAMWVDPSRETERFREQGGFAGLDLNKWGIAERDGKYRIRTYLFGIREEDFDAYCRQIGEDPSGYYDQERIRAVAVSMAPVYPNVVNNSRKSDLSYAHLNLSAGEELLLEERTEDAMKTDCVLPMEIGAVAQEGPQIGDIRNSYTVNLYMPLSVYYAAIGELSEEKAERYHVNLQVRTEPEDDLAVTDKIEELCGLTMAQEDVLIISNARERRDNEVGMQAMTMVTDCIGALLALIGISNTLSSVHHTMLRRRREFAMLRSVGMDNRGVARLLFLEGLRMAAGPVVIALAVTFAAMQMLMCLLEVSWRELLPWLPWGKVLLCVTAVVSAVALSYLAVTGRIRRDTIIEAVREENV